MSNPPGMVRAPQDDTAQRGDSPEGEDSPAEPDERLGSDASALPASSSTEIAPAADEIVLDTEALAELDRVVPGAAARVVDNALEEADSLRRLREERAEWEHIREMDIRKGESERNQLRRTGQVYTGLVTIVALVVAGIGMFLGYGPAQVALIIVAASLFIGTWWGNARKNKALARQLQEFRGLVTQLNQAQSGSNAPQLGESESKHRALKRGAEDGEDEDDDWP